MRDPCRNPFYIGTLSDDYFIEYVYGSDPVDLIIDNFKVDPPVCPITYECQSASGCDIPGVSSFNAGRFTFETNNLLIPNISIIRNYFLTFILNESKFNLLQLEMYSN